MYIGAYFDPRSIPFQGKYTLLSKRFTGDVLATVSDRELDGLTVGAFTLRGLYIPMFLLRGTLLRAVLFCSRAVAKTTYRHYFVRRYDAIVAPEPLITGIVALVIGLLTGAKVVVEVNGQFETAFSFDRAVPTLKDRLKAKYANFIIPRVLPRADLVKLLYAGQIDNFVEAKSLKAVTAFPNFVSTSQFRPAEPAPYILFLGYPWYLKGVDLLITAFKRLSADFPGYSLKIVGYDPDKSPFEAQAAGHDRIALCDPVEYHDVLGLMGACSLFVLPSRTEGMGRVLMEAMACRKPIVAARVGGIPSIVRDGFNGLLFAAGSAEDLEAKMRKMLGDPELAQRLAANGEQFVKSELTEDRYVERFGDMIDSICPPSRRTP